MFLLIFFFYRKWVGVRRFSFNYSREFKLLIYFIFWYWDLKWIVGREDKKMFVKDWKF